jgi:murein DD-endopeptidase MepM/ murein hydrolase activator NlpD
MTAIPVTHRLRLGSALAVIAALSACSGPIDLDMRGRMGGSLDTAAAAQTATASRPSPDNRGVISYPSYQVAVAQRGDTVASLAQRVGLSASELAFYNGVRETDPLRGGEVIALPRRVAEPSPATGAAITGPIRPASQVDVTTLAGAAIDRASPSSARAAPVQTGFEPVRHRVERGETAFTIARLYNVSPRALAEWNGLDKDFTLREGQFLMIPAAAEAPRARQAAATTAPGSGSPTPVPPSSTRPLPAETPPPAAAAKPAPAPKPVADIGQGQSRSNAAMAMPVDGRIIREYAKGKNEGIDIAAGAGTAVKAAASGQVAAITKNTENVNIVVIRHPDDVLTIYTHLDGLTIQKGDQVSRGQSIGKVRAGDPAFLHFEVRKGFDSVDPMGYLQ